MVETTDTLSVQDKIKLNNLIDERAKLHSLEVSLRDTITKLKNDLRDEELLLRNTLIRLDGNLSALDELGRKQ